MASLKLNFFCCNRRRRVDSSLIPMTIQSRISESSSCSNWDVPLPSFEGHLENRRNTRLIVEHVGEKRSVHRSLWPHQYSASRTPRCVTLASPIQCFTNASMRHVGLTNTVLLERLDYLLDVGLMSNVVELKSSKNRVCSRSDAGEKYGSALLNLLSHRSVAIS